MRANHRTIPISFMFLAIFASLLGGALTVTPARAAGIVVNSNADTVANNGECTLREAITNANGDNQSGSTDCAAGSGADSITFAANYTITLVGSQLPAITTEMTITGNGAANTIIQAGTCNPVTLKDNANANCTPTQNYRLFEVITTGNLTLNGVTVRHGVCLSGCYSIGTWGGGILNLGALSMTGSIISGNRAYYGGGMMNNNSYSSTLTNVTVSGNLGISNGGGMYNQNSSTTLTNVTLSNNSSGNGGGIQNDSNLTLTNVTFSNNSATNGAGGGMYNFFNSSPTLTNVTFSGNSANTSGGGMVNFGGSPTLTNVTFSGNSANTSGGGMFNADSSTPLLTNVIIANSTSGGNCYNDATSLNPASSHNLIDSASSCGLTDGNLGNKIGASYNAMLGPLANNGGSTRTHALLAGSPAIDAGANCPATDQRGVPRPQGAACDIGAYEDNSVLLTVRSNGKQDGWVLESSETSGKGGILNNGAKTIHIGDDADNKQYRTILSFNTAALPDNAAITKVTLKVKRQSVTGGGNPITIFGGFMVDIKKGNFGTAGLQLADFSTKGSKTYGAFKPKAASGGWYSINLTTGKNYINKLGNTQIRLRFKLDDNNDFTANFLSIHSGNAGTSSRPQLIVEYGNP